MTAAAPSKVKPDPADTTRTLRITIEDALADLLEPLGRLEDMRGDLAALNAELRRWAEQKAELTECPAASCGEDLPVLINRLDDVCSMAQQLGTQLNGVPTLSQFREIMAARIEPVARAVSEATEAARSAHAECLDVAQAQHTKVVASLRAIEEADDVRHRQVVETLGAARGEVIEKADLLRREVMQAVADRPRHDYLELRALSEMLEAVELTPVSGRLSPWTNPERFATAMVLLTANVAVVQLANRRLEVFIGRWRVKRVEDRWYPARLSTIADRAVTAALPVFATASRPLLRRLLPRSTSL